MPNISIKNTTTGVEDDLDRQRLPRHIGKDGILKPYDLRESLGQSWLREVHSGKYASEFYLCHLELRVDDLCAIVTETRVLMIHIKKVKLEYDAKYSGKKFTNYQICVKLKLEPKPKSRSW